MSQQASLLGLLSAVAGKKTLVLDKSLSPLISSLASFSLLQEHGIESVKWLDAPEVGPKVVIICRPQRDGAAAIRRIATMPGKQVTVILVPRRTPYFDEQIEPVAADLDIHVLPVYYRKQSSLVLVDGEHVRDTAVTLVKLQQEMGLLHRLTGKGAAAQQLASLCLQLRADVAIEQKTELEPGTLGDCIIMDRATDQLTPLLTQLTYEGLLYESFDVADGVLDRSGVKTSLEDDIFSDLRDENFSKVGPKLSGKASTLAAGFEQRHQAKTTTALKAFVGQIPTLQGSQKQLKMHVELAETLMQRTRSQDFRRVLELEQSIYSGESESQIAQDLEMLMARQIPLPGVLRLLCCWSCVHNGLKQTNYIFFAHRLTQAYGFSLALTLQVLAQRGLLVVRTPAMERGRGSWLSFSRSWKLLTENDDDSDLGFLYSGYAPLSLRILQGLMEPSSLDSFETLYKALRGPSTDVKQSQSHAHREDVLVIVFLGGCTATELTGVRWLAKRLDREILVVTNRVITGNDLVAC